MTQKPPGYIAVAARDLVSKADLDALVVGETPTDITGKADKVGTSDIEITDTTKGVILKSPAGTRYRVTVGNDGALTTTVVP